MDPLVGEFQVRAGDEVHSSDDHKLGKVVATDSKFITVEHGLFNKTQFYVPVSAVNAANNGKVYLNMTKDQIAHSKWETPPPVVNEAENPPISL